MSKHINGKGRNKLREQYREKIKLATVSLVKAVNEANEDVNDRGELKPTGRYRIRKTQEVLLEAITLGISGGLDLHRIIGGAIQPIFLRMHVNQGALGAIEEVINSFPQEEKAGSERD